MAIQDPVLKVLTSDQWDRLQRDGETVGAPVDVADGFVHLSTPAQVGETIQKHFAEADLLFVLTFAAADLGADLRWEPSRGGQDFPHLYAPLRHEHVRAVRRLAVQPTAPVAAPERFGEMDAVGRDGDERTLLVALLDWHRDGIMAKVAGLTDEQARQRHVASETTIIGIVHHLGMVEDWWFEHQFLGRPWREPWGSVDWDATPDLEFTSARDLSLVEVVEGFRAAVERSRAITEGAGLDDLGVTVSDRRGPFSMRWLLLHLLEEYARHLGHLDVLRELTDGATGQ